jgi:hypothetical protein
MRKEEGDMEGEVTSHLSLMAVIGTWTIHYCDGSH